MSARASQTTWTRSDHDDIDPELLQKTQAYLETRRLRQPMSSSLSEAWEQFYSTYNQILRHLAVACGVRPAELDECVQEVWATLVAKLGTFHHDSQRGRFTSWLYILVHSKAADLVRARTRHPTEQLAHATAAELRGREADPAVEYAERCDQSRVRDALDGLRKQISDPDYSILRMHWLEGRPLQEIAAVLNLTPGQVWTRHHRVKSRLRLLLNSYAHQGVA
jgi:RNA polymerase sigma factor (sigma-70 family)